MLVDALSVLLGLVRESRVLCINAMTLIIVLGWGQLNPGRNLI